MLKKKTAVLSLLLFALAASLTVLFVNGAADEERPTKGEVSLKVKDKIYSDEPNSVIALNTGSESIHNSMEDVNSPDNSLIEWSETATSTDKKATTAFTVPKDYGHVKVYFLNQSKGTVIITMTHAQSGLVYLTESVAAGKEAAWSNTELYPQGLRSGDYTIQYKSSSVRNVKVYISGSASNHVVL